MDQHTLLKNILKEYHNKSSKWTKESKYRRLGALEAILILNESWDGGETFKYKENQSYESLILEKSTELLAEMPSQITL